MVVAETFVIEIGAAVAKAIVKAWLKDTPASEASGGIVEVIGKHVSGVVAQRQAHRQFEDIGDRLASDLLPWFERESGPLEENERISVTLAVADALTSAQITARMLPEMDVDGERLATHVLKTRPHATETFSEASSELYRRLVVESCRYIARFATKLPSFTEESLRAILSRERELAELATQTIVDLRSVRVSLERAFPANAAQEFESKYREIIIEKLDRLRLFGVDVPTAKKWLRLSVAYLGLQAATSASPQRGDGSDPVQSSAESVEQILARYQYLVIRGEAGSGKTTLLQWIAVQAANEPAALEGQDHSPAVPFFIQLRQHLDGEFPRPEQLPALIAPEISGVCPPRWVHETLSTGRACVLIDGLDEIPAARRDAVHDWLEGLVQAFPSARFLVTTRPAAISEEWLTARGFIHLALRPLDRISVPIFIDKWHEAARAAVSEHDKDSLDDMASHLKQLVASTPALLALATTPLICAVICALHLDRQKWLPMDRLELYAACCSMLLMRRDPERRIATAELTETSAAEAMLLLQDFAYWLLRNGWTEVPTDQAAARFASRLRNFPALANTSTGEGVLTSLLERSGLLRVPVAGWVDFIHPTFQDYLAAQAALNEGDTGLLVKNAHDVQWRDVVVLAAGLAVRPIRRQIVRQLITRGDRRTTLRRRLYVLAAACLSMSPEIDEVLNSSVTERIGQLVPPKTETDALELAAAGDIAVQHLRTPPEDEEASLACVRTLSAIGTQAALDALLEYATDGRTNVRAEVARTWRSFEPVTFVQRILTKLVTPESALDLPSASTLRGLEHIRNLRTLRITSCNELDDLTPLLSSGDIEVLELGDCFALSDLSPLASLKNLRSLSIANCPRLLDLDPVGSLPHLRTLSLSNCPSITDIRPLATLSEIATLSLRGFFRLTDIGPLRALQGLSELSLAQALRLQDLSPLAALSKLERLDLDGCQGIRDYSPLDQMPELREVDGIPPDVVTAGSWARIPPENARGAA